MEARIASIRKETPTVKSFTLALAEPRFSFRPGQWVDLYIDDPVVSPDLIIGGFSITSSPLQKGQIELAVKRIPHGLASVYMHEHARIEDVVTIDGGHGDFYYDVGMSDTLVLIGGGIGITPLMSIVRFVDEALLNVSLALYYSAKTPSELAFRGELETIAARNSGIRCHFTVTEPARESWQGPVGRIDRHMLAAQNVDRNAVYYVCGPPGFAQGLGSILMELGVNPGSIRSEAW